MKRRARAGLAVVVCALSLVTAGPAFASDPSEIPVTVANWVGAINSGDFGAVAAACTPHAAIVDGFPPYAWQSCAQWMSDYKANNKAIHAPLGLLAIGRVLYTEVSHGRAYVIYPITFTDAQNGKRMFYKGVWTLTLLKTPTGWKFTGAASAWY